MRPSQRATEAGWAVSAQAVAAYLRSPGWRSTGASPTASTAGSARVAEVEAIAPEPHVQLAAAALNALRRADAGDREGARTALRAATTGLTESAPPVLADRLLLVEAELLRRTGDLRQAADVLTRLHGPATPHTAHALARLHLAAGDAAAAEQSLAPFPRDGHGSRAGGRRLLRTLIAAEHDRVAACSCWRTRCSRPPPSACAAPSWWRRPACGRCSATGSRPAPRQRPSPWTCCAGCPGSTTGRTHRPRSSRP